MEGGSSSTACLMAFGDNSSNGLCPMMMMPLMTTSNPNAADANTLFLPLPPNHNHDLNRNSSRGSSLILENHNHNQHTTTTSTNNHHGSDPGCYFMEAHGNNDGSTSSVKAKIMAHPHYHRLLAAYANCQKVKNEKFSLRKPNTRKAIIIVLISIFLSNTCIYAPTYQHLCLFQLKR